MGTATVMAAIQKDPSLGNCLDHGREKCLVPCGHCGHACGKHPGVGCEFRYSMTISLLGIATATLPNKAERCKCPGFSDLDIDGEPIRE